MTSWMFGDSVPPHPSYAFGPGQGSGILFAEVTLEWEAFRMIGGHEPSAWLLMAVGDDRQHGGNAGYDDQVDAYYTWDSTVPNSSNVAVGDAVALWDKQQLLGISVVEEIPTVTRVKIVYRCPNCKRASIKLRKSRSPSYRCQSCEYLFDEPTVVQKEVTEYRSRHDAGWSPIEGAFGGALLRSLCRDPRSQLSMRQLDWVRLKSELERAGQDRAIKRVEGRAPDLVPVDGRPVIEFSQGYSQAMVRVRRGQGTFRHHLLETQGESCAMTGAAPARALEAGHLYSYAKLGEHHEHGGFMLRRDIHRLFDDGSLAIDPGSLKVDVSPKLESYAQYARLHGSRLEVAIRDVQQEWLEKHWAEHRG